MADSDRPNILFILADDHGAWALGCAGNAEIKTPNLDRIAASGAMFSSFFCVSPVCSPARASILTGRIPSRHGVHDWLRAGSSTIEPDRDGRLTDYLEGQTAYSELLAADGYLCGISGKWHLGDSHHPHKGFEFWEVHATGGGPYYGAPLIRGGEVCREERYVTDVITDNALEFLDRRAGDERPFYLSVHYTAPHSPWEREQHPREVFDKYHADCRFHSAPQEPMHPWQINSAPYGHDESSRRNHLSGYYAAITEMDRNVGRLVDRLEAQGLRESTLVVFTGDNGMNMGHHGIYGKGNGTFPQNMYDTSVKVPMLISRPGHVPAGLRCDDLLSHYDVMPTLLEYCSVGNPEAASLPGRSFSPLLRGGSPEQREDIVVFDEYGPTRMIRTRTHKYVHRYPYGPHELYDLQADPDERENLYDRESAVARELKGRLEEWFVRYCDPARDGSREPVTGKGQLGLVGPAGRGESVFADDWHYLGDGRDGRGRR